MFTSFSDDSLIELMHAGAPDALPAREELRSRHLPRVSRYLLACVEPGPGKQDPAARAFDIIDREFVRGAGLNVPVRLRALRLSLELAIERGEPLRPDVHGPRHQDPAALRAAYATLAPAQQSALWYVCVDALEEADSARLLGVHPENVRALADESTRALRKALVVEYARRGPAACRGYSRLLEVAARPGDRRQSPQLADHLGTCDHCAPALADLIALTVQPGRLLATGLLDSGAEQYLATMEPATAAPSPGTAHGAAPRQKAGRRPRWHRTAAIAAGATLGGAVLAVLLLDPAPARDSTSLPPRPTFQVPELPLPTTEEPGRVTASASAPRAEQHAPATSTTPAPTIVPARSRRPAPTRPAATRPAVGARPAAPTRPCVVTTTTASPGRSSTVVQQSTNGSDSTSVTSTTRDGVTVTVRCTS
ncbi:hypothetical protein [Streptomyces bauhiniae]|uniref:hypothetical protein n=1 Tax=Streptomyces bauhiniae TaxID=2340725 RepID=UPI00364F348F